MAMKLLYATDGSPVSEAAAHLLAKLLNREGTSVTVVTVTPARSIDPDDLLLQLDPIEKRREDSAKIVQHATETLRDAGFEVEASILEGHPGHELVKAADEGGFDVVVVGAGSHSWMGNRLLGSVSSHVLHAAGCSVVVVHEASDPSERGRVVVGVDGSEASLASVDLLGTLLEPGRCTVEVIAVIQLRTPVVAAVPVGVFVPDERVMEQEEKILRDLAGKHVAEAMQVLEKAGFETTSQIYVGSPTGLLLDHVRSTGADLLTVGSRGLGAMGRVILGSVSDQVARLAPATLVVKATPS